MKDFKERFLSFPLSILVRPFNGFDELKFKKKGETLVANVLLAIYVLLAIAEYLYTGFIINENNPLKFNLLRTIAMPIVPILLLTIANWAVGTLSEGKGKLIEIYQMLMYSLVPLIIAKVIALLMSHLVILDEVMFYNLVLQIGFLWTILLAVVGMIVIHEFTLKKTIITIILTFVSATIILFLFILLFSLVQQLIGFMLSLIKEIEFMLGG